MTAVFRRAPALCALITLTCAAGANGQGSDPAVDPARSWLAGDHHIHSRYSVRWDASTDPPSPIVAGDAKYPIPRNAEMAHRYGLSWMVATDHGGPNHSKVNLELAYPELLAAREAVPEVIQFYGMEFDPPAAEHASLIVPHSHDEAATLHDIEHGYDRTEAWPRDTLRDTEAFMLDALRFMGGLRLPPVLIANHPSRSAPDLGTYGAVEPAELRNWNDAAPHVAVGMEGAPGHQASALEMDGSIDSTAARGGYRNAPTMGGFDQMTARLGGFWDSMLGEGRRWWITSTSDSHVNWREGGSDFWPGEYSKTYVYADRTHDDILDGLRNGRVFVTTGDLIAELFVEVRAPGDGQSAGIGGVLAPGNGPAAGSLEITIRLRDPEAPNAHGDRPVVRRVDLIMGDVLGTVDERATDTNPSTRVIRRFTAADWTRDGEWLTMSHSLSDVDSDRYIRVRGTSTEQLEPEPDPRGEDPWSDLWFYSNPVFIEAP